METRICPKCKKELPLDMFHKNIKRGLQVYCKTCRKEVDSKYYKNNRKKILKQKEVRKEEIRKWFIELKKTIKCENCGETRWYCLDFHHKEHGGKEYDVGSMINSMGKKTILNEIKKCICLCANCHREFHHLNKIGM